MKTILKLGGSVLTVKDEPETVAEANLDRVVDAIADSFERVDPDRGGTERGGTEDNSGVSENSGLVLVHGGGSFGHHHAAALGASVTDGVRDAAAIYEIHASMKRLNHAVLAALHARGLPALPVHPLSAAARDEDGALTLPAGTVATMLAEGFVPVLHGDVVARAGAGATVLSGDELVASLASSLGADRVGLCSAVPGVLDADGEVVPEIRSFDEVADALGGSDATDVTGGMAGKVRELLAMDAPACVFDLEALPAFLAGETPGTRIR